MWTAPGMAPWGTVVPRACGRNDPIRLIKIHQAGEFAAFLCAVVISRPVHDLGEGLHLEAALRSQRLDLQQRYLLRDLQLDLAGTLQDLALQLRGKAQIGSTQLALQGQAQGGQVSAGQWHAHRSGPHAPG